VTSKLDASALLISPGCCVSMEEEVVVVVMEEEVVVVGEEEWRGRPACYLPAALGPPVLHVCVLRVHAAIDARPCCACVREGGGALRAVRLTSRRGT